MLTELILRFSSLGDAGAVAFSNGLGRNANTSLEVLDLGWTGIGALGATAMAEMLRNNTSLKDVSLTANPIGDVEANSLAQALTVNTSLKKLRLCGIGRRGLDSFALHLPAMTGLEDICIQDLNGLTRETVETFLGALERNADLRSVYLGHATGDRDSKRLVKKIMPKVNLQMLLNRSGKRILTAHNVPNALWPKVFAKSSKEPDVLFYFLRERPDLLVH